MGLCCFTPSGFTHRLRFTPESRTAISHAIFVLRGMIIEAEADDDVETAVPMQEEVCAGHFVFGLDVLSFLCGLV